MAKMFRKIGLPHVTVKDPNVKQWALRLSKTLDDLSTEQAKQYITYIDEQIANVETEIENSYDLMLTYEEEVLTYEGNILTWQV